MGGRVVVRQRLGGGGGGGAGLGGGADASRCAEVRLAGVARRLRRHVRAHARAEVPGK